MTFLQFFQSLFQRLYIFVCSFFDNFVDDFQWMLKKRTKNTYILPPDITTKIVSTLDKEIFYAKMCERERRIKPLYYNIDEFISKYILIPRQYRLKLLDASFENYKDFKKQNRRSEGFYSLSMILISLLQDYEEFIKEEDLEFLKKDLFYFLSIHRSRIFNYLLDNLMEHFKSKYVYINPRDLQHTRVIWQINNEVAYRPFMAKYYEHEESFNSHSGM